MIQLFQRTLTEWRTVFWIAFGVFNITNLVYIIFASGEPQPWNFPAINKAGDEPAAIEGADDKVNKSEVGEVKFTDIRQ